MDESRSCTSILIGSKASIDGSILIGRNEDCGSAFAPVLFEIAPAQTAAKAPKTYTMFNKTEVKLPRKARRRYSRLPEADRSQTGDYASAGFNDAGVGLSATESIYGGCRALAFDPQPESGIAEDAIPDLVLPYISTAREGIELLGRYIRDYGSSEGNGILFADSKEVWYMEIPSGHHWIAVRIPEDQVGVAPNIAMIEEVDLDDKANVIASPGLADFVREHHLNMDFEGFNFRRCFGTCDEQDRIYNTPRAWDAIRRLAPNYCEIKKFQPLSQDIPFMYCPERKLDVTDAMDILASHFNETIYDPLGSQGTAATRTRFRPISVAKTQESHILQIQPAAPEGLRDVIWVSIGATAYSPYLPFFANAESGPSAYREVSELPDLNQAFWLMRTYDLLAEELRFVEGNVINGLRIRLCSRGLARIEEIRSTATAKKLKGAALTRFLTEENQKTCDEFLGEVKKTLARLLKTAYNRSKLTFVMNPDL